MSFSICRDHLKVVSAALLRSLLDRAQAIYAGEASSLKIETSPVQSWKACLCTLTIRSGSLKEWRLVQLSNADRPILVNVIGNKREPRLLQFLKA